MFDIGWGELLVIGIVALVVIGPKELPGMLRTLGVGMTKLRRMASEFQGQFQDAMREAELADLKKEAEKLIEPMTSAASFNPLATIGDELQKAVDPPPAAAPVPADTPGAGAMPPIAAVAPVVPPETEAASATSADSEAASASSLMPPIAAAAPVVPPELEQQSAAAEPAPVEQPKTGESKSG